MLEEGEALEGNDDNTENSVDLPKEDVQDIERAVEESMEKDEDLTGDDDDDKEDDAGEADTSEEPDKDKELPSEDDDNVSDEDNQDDSDDDNVSDEKLEKAISLGVPIAEARKLGSKLLDSRIAVLEEKDSSQDENSDESDDTSKDLLSDIPDLDPDVYDEELVQGFSAMKQIIRDQAAMLGNLSKSGKEAAIRGKLDTIENAVKALDANPGKEVELKEKVDILTAGYKSVGKEVSDSAILAEAVSSVLGEDIAKVAAGQSTAKVKKRSAQKIARSTGGRGSESKDVYEAMGEELDRKYFDKK